MSARQRSITVRGVVPGAYQIELDAAPYGGFPYVHDRFAIIDSELLHFGSTVGGLHPDVSAATRE